MDKNNSQKAVLRFGESCGHMLSNNKIYFEIKYQ